MSFIRKNLYHLIITLAVIFLLLQSFIFSADKIAYVDSVKLLDGYKSMIQARDEFKLKQAVWNANVDSLTTDVQDAIKAYERRAALGTENEKKLSRELISIKQKQLYDYQAAVKQNAVQEEQRLTKDVLSTLNSYLLDYGRKHNYTIILIAANGNIAYADDAIDLTDEVVEDLNKGYSVPQTSKK